MGLSRMSNKPLTDKKNARMYFKRLKAGMDITADQYKLVCRFYPFMKNTSTVVVVH